MAEQYKPNIATAFTSGELTPALAGRVDIEDYKYGARLIENFIPEVQGGLKKFYGTRNIATIDSLNDFVMVPFDGADDPIVLLFHDGKISVIASDDYYDLEGVVPQVTNCSLLRWAQMNDKIFFAHPDCPPFTIELLGLNRETKKYEFVASNISDNLISAPFFPLGFTGNYGYDPEDFVTASGYKGDITIEAAAVDSYLILKLPDKLKDIVGQRNVLDEANSPTTVLSAGTSSEPKATTVGTTVISLIKEGVDEPIKELTIGSVQNLTLGESSEAVVPTMTFAITRASSVRNPLTGGTKVSTGGQPASKTYISAVTKTITADNVLSLVQAVFPNARWSGSNILVNNPDGMAGEKYSIKITQGESTSESTTPLIESTLSGATYSVYNNFPGYTQQGDWCAIIEGNSDEFKETDVVGRYIKFQVQDVEDGVATWAKGITVKYNQIVYSDNSYYRCVVTGLDETTGDIQPTHKSGIRSDGKVKWEYLHSGTGVAKVTGQISDTQLRAHVIGNLPVLDLSKPLKFNNFQWSIWGYKGRYPGIVFFFKGRLGYFTNTIGYGTWVSMSKSDEFNDFGTETYGTNLDTDGITSLITGHPNNCTNWVLSGERLYFGSYSGEYVITGARDGTLTPINYSCTPVSTLGGAFVPALKFKELNLFVGTLSNEVNTISYDYTRDDYVPTNIGFFSTHLLNERIASWYALNNNDRNIYFLTESGNVNIINYVKEMKMLGFYRLNFGGNVLGVASSNAGVVSAMYFIVERDGILTIEREEHDFLSYVLDRRSFEQETPENVTISEFSGSKVYVVDSETFEYYHVDVPDSGVIPNKKFKNFYVGLPMVCKFHGMPMSGEKLEGVQQKAIAFNIRLRDSGAFEYGTSHDFNKWSPYKMWNTMAGQEYNQAHKLLTGDIRVPTPSGYMQAANKGDGLYPNDTGVALNLRCETPEPFNLLMISNVYV